MVILIWGWVLQNDCQTLSEGVSELALVLERLGAVHLRLLISPQPN